MATEKQATKKSTQIIPVPVGNTSLEMASGYEDQVNLISFRTPKEFIKQREGRGGKRFDYVETNYVIARLNATFLYDWDLEIIEEKIFKEIQQIATKVKLTVRFLNGKVISKTAWGGSDIKVNKAGDIIDIADDLKSSESDALKKAASMLGICWDVYSGMANSIDEKTAEDDILEADEIDDDAAPDEPDDWNLDSPPNDISDDIADMASNPDEDAEEANLIAGWIKTYLVEEGIDYADFKQFLFQTKWTPPRKFVGKKFGNLSITEGNVEDLRYLKKNIDKAVGKYRKQNEG